MAITLFVDATYSLTGLVESIRRGEVALPDIQRPFVWQSTRVRDLFDSMYRGFPVGYLLFWSTGADPGARQIGTDTKEAAPRLLIVDGQQRLTSLFAVMTGTPVVREDYSEKRIEIGFRPADETFVVTDAAVRKDPEFVPDISTLWTGRRRDVVRDFMTRLEQKRELTQDQRDQIDDALDRVFDLKNYPFKVVELAAEVDEEQVAEVFVRINSEGVKLNRADFILTLMSVFWEKGRRELEDFSRTAKKPSTGAASPFNWFIHPQPAQLLRVSVALGLRRAVLKNVYTLLRGRDLETGLVSEEARTRQFARLQSAQKHVLDLTNWHEFLQCVERAGFRSATMITSDNALLYSYAVWLIGRVDYGMSVTQLREVIARWFFMVHTTSRYSGSFESRAESDLARFQDVNSQGEFVVMLDRIIGDTLSADYWNITLPNDLATSASRSPALSAYIAALNILDADALMGTAKVRSRLDPAITAKKGIERHHLFPKGYLRKDLGITDTKQVNQIANMALVDWPENIDVSDDAPASYWPEQAAKLPPDVVARQVHDHALPSGWTTLPYQDFLAQRRQLMGQVVRRAFGMLQEKAYAPVYPEPVLEPERFVGGLEGSGTSYPTVAELMERGLLREGSVLMPVDAAHDALATVLEDGRLDVDGKVYENPEHAAIAVAGADTDGWTFWVADTQAGQRSLAALADNGGE